MKERIISALKELSDDPASSLLADLSREMNLEADELQQRSKNILSAVLHNYTRLSISTIDSFFQKIIRSFARETGLNSSFILEMDEEKVLELAVEKLLEKVGKDKYLTEWLLDFGKVKLSEGKSWDVKFDIQKLSSQILKEDFKKIAPYLFQENFQEKLFALKDQLRHLISQTEEFIQTRGKEMLVLIDSFGLMISDFTYGQTGVAGYISRIANGRGADCYEYGVRVTTAMESPEGWYSKTSDKKEEIKQAVNAGLLKELNLCVKYWESVKEDYISATEVMKNLYSLGILGYVSEEIAFYRKENDTLLISDLASLLKNIVSDNDSPFIYQKTGDKYHHFLIDEFQDTSHFQWQNLRPLLVNGLSEEHFSLIVGDVKQSIYRFRGGDWKLLLNDVEKDLIYFEPHKRSLQDNWRSKEEIISFNNLFFKHSAKALEQQYTQTISQQGTGTFDFSEMQSSIEKAYADVEQNVPEKGRKQGGYAEVNLMKKPEEGQWQEAVESEIPALIERLQAEGYQAKDITFLVRTASEGARIAFLINDYKIKQGKKGVVYDIVSADSLKLHASPTIHLIVAAVNEIIQPTNPVNTATLKYHLHLLEEKEEDLHMVMTSNQNALYNRFRESRNFLKALSLYELCEEIIRIFALNQRKENQLFLQFFLDAILEYTADPQATINGFSEWWELRGQFKSIILSEAQNAMRIVTVHKSKGLQYKVLIMPFTNWKLETEANKGNILWDHCNKEPFNSISFLPLKYNKQLQFGHFKRAYFQELLLSYMDNLNILYVGFTRAIDRLYVFAPLNEKKKDKLSTVGDLLNLYCNTPGHGLTSQDSETEIRYSLGTENIYSSHANTTESLLNIEEFHSNRWRSKLHLKTRSTDFLEPGMENILAKANYGKLIHTILSKIRIAEDTAMAINSLYYEGVIDDAERLEISQKLEALLINPLVKDWFSKNWQTRNETEIIIPGKGSIRPDKVLVRDRKAIVVDFKTGNEHDSHVEQVKMYADCLKNMNYTDVEGYLLYISEARVVKVI